jgi:ribonuclease D
LEKFVSDPGQHRKPVLVTAREHLEEVAAEIGRFDRFAVDTESNGFYAYEERVCLIQISTPDVDYIVDPIAITDISSLGPLFADAAIEKIFHAGEYDLIGFKRDYEFRFANLFDTMIAGRLIGLTELGLASMLDKYFGIQLSKKLQKADWGLRPLTEEQIQYAQLDTHYLLALSDLQKEQLREKGRLEAAQDAFADLIATRPGNRSFDPEGYWRMVGRKDVSPAQISSLREIYLFRDAKARERNRAAFRVMGEKLMVDLAMSLPQSMAELREVPGMSSYLVQKWGAGVLEAIRRGLETAPPKRPAPGERNRASENLFEKLKLWRQREAARQGVAVVDVLSSSALKEIARAASLGEPDPLSSLSSFKLELYGDSLKKLLPVRRNTPQNPAA